MKILNLALFFGIISLNAVAEDNISVPSKIEEVTVYFQGAELVHTASANLRKGSNEVWITGLSQNIDRNSIKIKATNGVIISAFEFSMDFLSEKTLSASAQKLQDAVKEQQKLLDQIRTDVKINTSLLSILQKSIDKNTSGSTNGLTIDDLTKSMEYYRVKSGELEKVIASGREKEADALKSLNELKAQFEQESLKNNKASGMLKLTLSSPLDGTCTFTVSYYTGSAGWTPYYDFVVAAPNQPVKITSKAKVRQLTGIDWEKIRITLSTATPSASKSAPLFNTWFLRYVENIMPAPSPRNEKMMMQNSYSYDKKAEETDASEIRIRGAASVPEQNTPLYIVDGNPVDEAYFQSLDPSMIKDMQVLRDQSATSIYGSRAANGVILVTMKSGMDDFVTLSENQLNLTFNIDIPYSIPGNGKEQAIELKKQEIVASFKFYCAPKLNPETYLLAEIADWEKLNLLSGAANITYDGTYVGETYINANSTHQNLTLTLGTDKRIAVKREMMKDFGSTRFLGNDVRQEFAYQMTVRNNRNEAVRMVLKDQYPISTLKEITVELLKDTTTPTTNLTDLGVITWEYDMQPGETRTFKLVYTVKYPKGRKLNL